jgi:hypothetical protein
MWRPGTWGTIHGGRAESSPFGGIAAHGGGSSLATTRPSPSNGNPSEQQGHGQQPARSRRGATALAGAAHPAMGSRWHPPAQAHGRQGGGYSKRSLRPLASTGATGLLWVGFQSKPVAGIGTAPSPTATDPAQDALNLACFGGARPGVGHPCHPPGESKPFGGSPQGAQGAAEVLSQACICPLA